MGPAHVGFQTGGAAKENCEFLFVAAFVAPPNNKIGLRGNPAFFLSSLWWNLLLCCRPLLFSCVFRAAGAVFRFVHRSRFHLARPFSFVRASPVWFFHLLSASFRSQHRAVRQRLASLSLSVSVSVWSWFWNGSASQPAGQPKAQPEILSASPSDRPHTLGRKNGFGRFPIKLFVWAPQILRPVETSDKLTDTCLRLSPTEVCSCPIHNEDLDKEERCNCRHYSSPSFLVQYCHRNNRRIVEPDRSRVGTILPFDRSTSIAPAVQQRGVPSSKDGSCTRTNRFVVGTCHYHDDWKERKKDDKVHDDKAKAVECHPRITLVVGSITTINSFVTTNVTIIIVYELGNFRTVSEAES